MGTPVDIRLRTVMTDAALCSVQEVDAYIDRNTAQAYRDQPLAARWGRVAKVAEETGEVIEALIACTGQNPRKGVCGTEDDVLKELADVWLTAACAIQSITKDVERTQEVLAAVVNKAVGRMGQVTS